MDNITECSQCCETQPEDTSRFQIIGYDSNICADCLAGYLEDMVLDITVEIKSFSFGWPRK